MGCFLGCFGTSKNRRRQRRSEDVKPQGNGIYEESRKDDHLNSSAPIVAEVPEASVVPITDTCSDKVEEKGNGSPTRKRVTFNSNVKTFEHTLQEEYVELPNVQKENAFNEDKPLKPIQTQSSSENSSVTSNSSKSYPPNHRYQNCRESDDEEEDDLDCVESDLDDCNDDAYGLLDEDYYSDYKCKLQNQANEVYTEEIGDNGLDIEELQAKPRGSNASARDRSSYVHPILNPVENLTQWKAVKSKGRTVQTRPQKENLNLVSDQEDKPVSLRTGPCLEESSFSFKPESRDGPKKTKTREFAVDTSLSTWLSASETLSPCNSVSMGFEAATPERNTSCNSKPSHDDRPILGALTVEEIRQFSATCSPRISPSRSPDETPIIGSVGSYWNHSATVKDCSSASSFKGIPNTTSKYREDKRVNWHSTPFEARLERALNNKEH